MTLVDAFRTPLVECFRRGDAPTDVRLMAARGGLSLRPEEQLSLLMLLVSDADREVASAAAETIARLPAEALAAFYAYESQVPRVAKAKADGLAERYGADAKTCGYFKLHQFADVEHAQVWQELLTAEVAAHPGQTEAALDAAETAAQALWHALDGMEARRMATV